jgi:hypothetical protein
MNNVLQMVENEQTSEFYPTPENLVKKMLEGIDLDYIHTILEPSAGKGDILREIAKEENSYRNRVDFDVDCIEIDPYLRQILKYNFSEERRRQFDRWKDAEYKTFFEKGIHIVHDNFLTYTPFKQYDLIIMNPPFSNGDKHLLKALDMQKNGGNIVCLLNAETIRKPYTETRKELLRQLKKYPYTVEYIENAFVSAERKTGVEVALIKVAIEAVQEESDIYNRMKEAEQVEDFNPEVTDVEVSDYIKAAVCRFNVEVKAGLELIRQYKAFVPYMLNSFDKDDKYAKPILRLTDNTDRGYDSVSANGYLRKVRLKYWRALLSNPKFVGKLTSKLQEEYRESVDRLADYDFSEFNIYTLSAEMGAKVKQGIEDEIIAMFDRLTAEHSWYPETQKNRHYYDGWATNKAHKIGKKVIIPCYGVYGAWDGLPRKYEAEKVLADIERILNFLDGHMTAEVDSWNALQRYFDNGETKNIPTKFFTATFYKKGTVHLVFNCPELIERFNIYAAQNKAWLPPCYGKKKYKDMSADEKAVVDSFQGEQAYNEVMAKAGYYLAPVTNGNILLLGSGE